MQTPTEITDLALRVAGNASAAVDEREASAPDRDRQGAGAVSVEFEVLWDTLAQYVENTESVEELLDARALEKLNAARAMLERMDAAVSATAG